MTDFLTNETDRSVYGRLEEVEGARIKVSVEFEDQTILLNDFELELLGRLGFFPMRQALLHTLCSYRERKAKDQT